MVHTRACGTRCDRSVGKYDIRLGAHVVEQLSSSFAGISHARAGNTRDDRRGWGLLVEHCATLRSSTLMGPQEGSTTMLRVKGV
jgi:hypothetical protein